MIKDKLQIISALNEKIDAFNRYIESLDKEQFESAPNGKWSAGQNLDHLIRAIKPLQLAYSLPKFALLILFGKTNRSSRTYDELVVKYKSNLTAGGKASGPFVPKKIVFEQKDELIKITLSLLKDKTKRIKIAKKAVESAKDYSEEKFAKKIREIIL